MEVCVVFPGYASFMKRTTFRCLSRKMLITPLDKISLEKEKPERDKEKTMILNIPVGGKREVSPEKERTGNKASLLRSRYDENIELKLRGLTLSDTKQGEDDSESSDEEDVLDKESLVAKCPDRKKDAKKLELKNSLRPYHQIHHIPQYTNVGGLILVPSFIQPEAELLSQIPQPVEDFGRGEDSKGNESLVNELLNELTGEERQLLDITLDEAIAQTSKFHAQQPVRGEEVCYSPDSGYGNMSPPSVPPSPSTQTLSLYSPNPRFESRGSESDSSGECEPQLTPVESPFQKVPMVNCNKGVKKQSASQTIYLASLPASRPPTATLRILRPDSVQVDLVGIDKPAFDRLQEKKQLKKINTDMEWVLAVMDAKHLPPKSSIPSAQCESIKHHFRREFIELLRSGPKAHNFYEKLYCRMKLFLKKGYENILVDNELTTTSPLYIAAVNCNDSPLVVRLIVDILKPKESYDANGNTLLHHLAEKGDSNAQVLAEILHSKTFNVNHTNNMGETALHKAVKSHSMRSSLACVKLFIQHGASLFTQDFNRRTALHLAVSPEVSDPCQLLRALLMAHSANEAINLRDNDRNTALHLAASRNDLSLDKHKDLLSQLINSQARHDLRNEKERLALSFVAEDRKSDMKLIFNRRLY